MSECLSSSAIRTLEALPYNAIVINSQGIILFTNNKWNIFSNEYGLPPHENWIGANFMQLLNHLMTVPDQQDKLNESIDNMLSNEQLIHSFKFTIQTSNKGSRSFYLEAFPLISNTCTPEASFIISLLDVGSAHHIHNKLIPICASCKSTRNTKEEWITIEHFLKQQLSLQFTHDICPHCVKQLYPQYAQAFER